MTIEFLASLLAASTGVFADLASDTGGISGDFRSVLRSRRHGHRQLSMSLILLERHPHSTGR